MSKKEKAIDTTKAPRNYDSMLGILQVFVVVSIAYSSFLVVTGTEGVTPKVMVVPQVLFAAILFVKKFTISAK